MKKIKLTIEVSTQELEIANFCLAQFLELLKENEQFRKNWKISNEEIKQGENFRKELLKKAFKSESYMNESLSNFAELLCKNLNE